MVQHRHCPHFGVAHDGGVHQRQARDLVGVLLRNPQGERTPHAEAGDEDGVALGAQLEEGLFGSAVPVTPLREVQFLPARAVPGKPGERHPVAGIGRYLRPLPQRPR